MCDKPFCSCEWVLATDSSNAVAMSAELMPLWWLRLVSMLERQYFQHATREQWSTCFDQCLPFNHPSSHLQAELRVNQSKGGTDIRSI